MGYSVNEFPHADYYQTDLRELIRLYNELRDIYNNLQDEIQEVIDYINNFESDTDEKIKNEIQIAMSLYTQRLINVENLVKQLEAEVATFDENFDKINGEITALSVKILDNYIELSSKNNELVELLHEYKNNIDSYVDFKAEELEKYIEEKVTKLDRLDVTNPINGKFEDINIVLEDMFNVIQQSYSLTAKEYDALKLSAAEYDRMKIKAIDYDTKGFLIFWELRQGLMISPFTGSAVKISTVVYQLADLHRCTFTAQQYDNIGFTAQEYDAWKISAFNYDWFGRKMVLERKSIPAQTYDNLKLSASDYDKKELTASQYDVYGNALLTLIPTLTICTCQACNSDVLQPTN